MKKISKTLVVLMAITMIGTLTPAMNTTNVYAKSKKSAQKLTYTLKNGTLTIKGKGGMSSKKTFKRNKKIKKVVISKGVTSISNNAFYKCKNLKTVKMANTVKTIGISSFSETGITKLTIPKSVKTIGQDAIAHCKSLKTLKLPGKFNVKMIKGDEQYLGIMYGTDVRNIYFTTNLDLNSVTPLESDNLYVSSSDKYYKSIGGVIYTKDGKNIVRVPAHRSTLEVNEGCNTFNIQAISYARPSEDNERVVGHLNTITLAASVKTVTTDKYMAKCSMENMDSVTKVNFMGAKMDAKSLSNLCNTFDISMEDVAAQLPNQVKNDHDLYVASDNYVIRYTGNQNKITLPRTITTIGSKAFYYNNFIKEVVMNDGLKEIDDYAFASSPYLETAVIPESVTTLGNAIFARTLISKVQLPAGIKVIPAYMYSGNSRMKDVTIPNTVKIVGEGSFESTGATTLDLGTGVTTIEKGAFGLTSIKTVTIPTNVVYIGDGAFQDNSEISSVSFLGNTDNYYDSAFAGCNGAEFTYSGSANTYKTVVSTIYRKNLKGNKKAKVKFSWNNVTNADGYEVNLSTSKKFNKNLKSFTAGVTDRVKSVTVKNAKQVEYVRVRTYKIINGRRVYGVWATNSI